MLRYVWTVQIASAFLLGCVEGQSQQGESQTPLPVANLVGFAAAPGRLTYDVRIENPSDEEICFESYVADKVESQIGVRPVLRLSRNDGYLRLDRKLVFAEEIVDGSLYVWNDGKLKLLPGGFMIARSGFEWFDDQATPIKRKRQFDDDPVPFTNEPFDPSELVYVDLEFIPRDCGPNAGPLPDPLVSIRGPEFVLRLP